ncbi:Mitochondrial import inner membrane translocase subunit tim21 [Psilocybe cubensis]|uniref:Mitochondrial import inner membrane translocase subunit tim21 n=2 Tax=Psilocybe cubensis TaxID=181762 RepID=A0ACB8HGE0_PSICU|nr:Mitochondrial import inner membrane translocase subunit tim21 [Psilocybe cubensis]KAH9487090.1 Mitochondrial import inner membrane translocase subunit tim21 [Psilocybe cubensis]
MDFGEKSKLLGESLDTRQRSEPKHDTVGPFQLGLSQQALRKGEKIPKWSELSTGGKVLRTTARTSNLGVILLGAGLSVLLVYSLTTELFSKNSPTVLYGDACEKIEKSARLAKYLNGPLTFHNNPPSAVRPRHRNRHVTSRVMVDQYGQEHMIMTFYVQGRPEGEHISSDESYLEAISNWFKDTATALPELSLDDAVEWSKETGQNVWEKSVRAFKYLSGSPLPPPALPALPPTEVRENGKKEEITAWSFAGIFSSLKGKKETGQSNSRPAGRQYTEGEVHADLVKNANGYFVFRYLLVDIPNSRDYNPIRVFIERQDGVRENEPVMRWVSS